MKGDFWFNKNVYIYAVLTGLCILSFNQIIFGEYYFFEDFLYQYYPFRNFFATSLRGGVFPLWDPYVFSGMSLIGDIQSALFYPFNIILIIFVRKGVLSYYALELQNIFHVLLAGVFTYMYAREVKLPKSASMVSAVTFMFSGFLITRMIHLTFINVIIWLPLILLFLQKALKENSYSYSILGGLFMGLSMLAGSPQFSLHIFYFLGFYTIFFILINRKDSSIVKPVLLLFVMLAFSLGIAAIQYLPSFDFSKYTVRSSISFEESALLSIHPVHLLTFIIPKLFGEVSVTGKPFVPFWGGGGVYGAFWENAIYVGIFPLVLLFFSFKDRKNKLVWFFTGIAIFSLLAALGRYTPLYKFIYYCLPGFNKFRIPGRFSGILSFSIAILAGFGANTLFNKREIKFPKVLFWLIGLVFIIWILVYAGAFKNINEFTRNIRVYRNIVKQYSIFVLFFSLSIAIIFLRTKKLVPLSVLAGSAIGLIFLDLFAFGHNFNRSKVYPQQFYQFNSLVRYLQEESKKEKFRINVRKDKQMILKRNSGNIYYLELIEGYTPLRIKRFVEFSKVPFERRLDLLNVKYRLEVNEETGLMKLVSNQNYLGRAFMVYKYTSAKEKNEILRVISSDEFDYRNEIILEEEPEVVIPSEDKNPVYKIEEQLFETNKIYIKIYTSAPGFLVLSEIYNPDWEAHVDGKKTKIYCANYTLRAIPIDEGTHRVELFYNPLSFKIGRIITIGTLVFAVCLLSLL
ncbi:YfhO family protein [candidate division WOR-3 bacterium]|nr:YfhO family protein [candidate division WOR-3 bacterium]